MLLGQTRLMFMCVLRRYVASTVLLVPKPFKACWQRRWIAACRWGTPLQWHNQLWQSLEEGARKHGRECGKDQDDTLHQEFPQMSFSWLLRWIPLQTSLTTKSQEVSEHNQWRHNLGTLMFFQSSHLACNKTNTLVQTHMYAYTSSMGNAVHLETFENSVFSKFLFCLDNCNQNTC